MNANFLEFGFYDIRSDFIGDCRTGVTWMNVESFLSCTPQGIAEVCEILGLIAPNCD